LRTFSASFADCLRQSCQVRFPPFTIMRETWVI
jgi:hypothetical protein